MKLINLDGLALLGPGSEWFWLMLQFVIVAITLYAIYRQLRLQASAAAIEQMDDIVKEWDSESLHRHQLEILIAVRDGVAPENLPYGAASTIGDFWEGIGYLVQAGHISARLLYENLSSPRIWWAVLTRWAQGVRIATGQPTALEHFEWLAGLMAEMDSKAGASTVYDASYIASTLNKRIQNLQERLRVAEAVRAVIVRPLSPATLTADANGG